jgi:hypothetical protein
VTFDLDDAAIWWTILGIVVVVFVVALVFLIRAARAARRIKRRTAAYASLPIVATIAKGQADVLRLQAAVAQLTALLARGDAALRVLRRGPIPADLRAAFSGLRAALAALRELASL